MIKKIKWFDLCLVGVLALMGSLLVFANQRSAVRNIEKIDLKLLSSNNHFITQEMVERLIIGQFPDSLTSSRKEIDLMLIENQLNQHPMIANSEVFLSVDGILSAEVSQKTAIARVINQNDSFYIDSEGNEMPLSEHYSAHVPLISGTLKEENKKSFIELLNKIYTDEFYKTTLTGIKINPDQSLVFTVRDYNYLVEFGFLKEIERKMDNYKAFVHYSKNDTIVKEYKNINLRFTEQVVCTK